MPLYALGVNHKTAPVSIRERLAFSPESVTDALMDLTRKTAVDEAAILATCNRTEIYCDLDADQGGDPVVEWLLDYHRLDHKALDPHLYFHVQEDAIRHALRVAAGLDSMILGEPQILGQMKDAYALAQQAGTVNKVLSRLFQHIFTVAKQIRTDTEIGSSPVSIAFAAVRLAHQIFGDLKGNTALLIGAGDTIELAARHLHENGLGRMIVANRTAEKAHLLASKFQGYAIALSELSSHLAEADIIISSTASPVPVLGKGAVESAIKQRKHRPMFMVDIAVPRDIEPEVSALDDVYLYTVDDLEDVIQDNLRSRQQAALQAEEIIETQVNHFIGWVQSLQAVSTIRHLRGTAEQVRDEAVGKAARQLANGADPQTVVNDLARSLTNKLIHTPCTALNQAGYDDRAELLAAARELFGLKDETID